MSYFAVIREAGPTWLDGRGAFDQPDVQEHAAFMNGLADEGVVLFAGPLAGTERDRIRVLVVMDAESEADVRNRLELDPWARAQRLETVNVETWNVIAGGDRLADAQRATR